MLSAELTDNLQELMQAYTIAILYLKFFLFYLQRKSRNAITTGDTKRSVGVKILERKRDVVPQGRNKALERSDVHERLDWIQVRTHGSIGI